MPLLSRLLFLFLFFISTHPSPFFAQLQQKIITSFNFSASPWRPTHNQILLSPNSTFAAGFQPLSSTSPNLFTFSVWYHNISQITVVWSANLHSPVNRSASLDITRSGELRLSNSTSSGTNLWPSKPVGSANTTRLTLGDDGNLVFGTWQSFDHPTNTILPNQEINGTALSSMNGKFRFEDSKRLVFNDSDSYWTIGNNNAFLKLDDAGMVSQEKDTSFISSDFGDALLRRLTLDEDGNLRVYSFHPSAEGWTVVWEAVQELCRIYGTCGPNYICTYNGVSSTYCVCPPGYQTRQVSGGQETCEIKAPITYQSSRFLRLDYVNYSGGSNQTNLQVRNFTTCRAHCLDRPNCFGFGFKYDGTGYCVLQLDRLLYGYWSPGTEAAMFLRVDRSENPETNFTGMTEVLETSCPVKISLPYPPKESNSTTRNIVIICTLFAAELLIGLLSFWTLLKKYIKYKNIAQTLGLELLPTGGPKRYSYAELKAATNDFSTLIGKGGFGDVYKGQLSDNQVLAVKCLKNVNSGDAEFWTEVKIIARMHHLNLVKLFGFCAEKGRRILVFEYVPNGSLANFLFQQGVERDSAQKPTLDWNIRYRIALGVARAIAYLHEECLEWVLHCDIKPDNILLGDDFCPKVSDFGLAKSKKKEDLVTMSRIRGTPGYMAPEWYNNSDLITPKVDVFSFGMVLLEIVSGTRNTEMQESKMDSAEWYFPVYVFNKVFKEMKVEDILDDTIKQSYDVRVHFDMVNRMVKTALWCVQDLPELRPSMGKVAKMLEGTVEIMEPKNPTIFFL